MLLLYIHVSFTITMPCRGITSNRQYWDDKVETMKAQKASILKTKSQSRILSQAVRCAHFISFFGSWKRRSSVFFVVFVPIYCRNRVKLSCVPNVKRTTFFWQIKPNKKCRTENLKSSQKTIFYLLRIIHTEDRVTENCFKMWQQLLYSEFLSGNALEKYQVNHTHLSFLEYVLSLLLS